MAFNLLKLLLLTNLSLGEASATMEKVIIDTKMTGKNELLEQYKKSLKRQKHLRAKALQKQVTNLAQQSASSNSMIDVGEDRSLMVPLESRNDAVYVGTLYVGADSQPARVVFDTGSEYLAVTSALCDDKTAGNYKFKVYDASYNDFIKKDVPGRCPTNAYDMHKSRTGKILSRSSSKLAYGSADL